MRRLVAAVAVAGLVLAALWAWPRSGEEPRLVALERPTSSTALTGPLSTAAQPGDLLLPRRTTTTTTTTTTVAVTAPPVTFAPASQPPVVTTPPPSAPTTTLGPLPPVGSGALCIGDSVMLGAGPEYHNRLSMCRVVDATVSRQFRQGDEVAASYAARKQLGDAVVVHLGTNGYVTAAEFDDLMQVLRNVKRVVIVNVQLHGSREWEGPVNAELAAGVKRWKNCVLADWKGVSASHPDWFGGDGIHLTAAGAAGYAHTVASAL